MLTTHKKLMALNRAAHHPVEDGRGDIKLMSIITIIMASLLYSVNKGSEFY